jgi:hypothetical protein
MYDIYKLHNPQRVICLLLDKLKDICSKRGGFALTALGLLVACNRPDIILLL